MAYSDTLTATLQASINASIVTAEGNIAGDRQAVHTVNNRLVDGSSSGQATGFFSSTFTATTGGITVSLADSADPLAAAGDDAPTMDPEGLKLRAILIENQDTTNFVDVEQGTNGVTGWIVASGDKVRVPAGGVLMATFPAGLDAMNDGSDDEILFSADTASVNVKLTYVFG